MLSSLNMIMNIPVVNKNADYSSAQQSRAHSTLSHMVSVMLIHIRLGSFV